MYISWFRFAVRYRNILLGPAWLLVEPALFIGVLGTLFSEVNGIARAVFIPHLTIGLVVRPLISNSVTRGPMTATVMRNRPVIPQR